MKYDLPDGEWVDLIDPGSLKMKHRDAFGDAGRLVTPVDDDGGMDRAAIAGMPGGVKRFATVWNRARRNAAIALAVTAWSYDLPVPEMGEYGEILSEASIGEVDPMIESLTEPHFQRLSAEQPDPKAASGSASNGHSKAKALSRPA